MFSQTLGQLPGINTIYSWDIVLLEPCGKRLLSIPVGVFPRVTGNDETRNMNFPGFKVLWKTVIINGTLIRDTVVSNQRIGKNKDLASVTWVRQGFRVSNHSSVEDNFTSSCDWGTERLSFKCVSICQVQEGFFTLLNTVNWNMRCAFSNECGRQKNLSTYFAVKTFHRIVVSGHFV